MRLSPPSAKYIAYSDLIRRGWTSKTITEFLGAPVAHAVNPHLGSGSPMRLYELKRVKAVEKMMFIQVARFSAAKD